MSSSSSSSSASNGLLPNRFNFGGMREGVSDTCRIHRQTFNAGAELLAYSALRPTSTLFLQTKTRDYIPTH